MLIYQLCTGDVRSRASLQQGLQVYLRRGRGRWGGGEEEKGRGIGGVGGEGERSERRGGGEQVDC